MRKWWADLMCRTLCKWFGHTHKLEWRPIFKSWYGTHSVYSGQCRRCWRVISERERISPRGATAMEREAVSSSMISSIGYDVGEEVLEVEFNNGAVYRYAGVPQYEYDALMSAPSIGRHFNEFIKSQYPPELA